jgi:hypothetical protein
MISTQDIMVCAGNSSTASTPTPSPAIKKGKSDRTARRDAERVRSAVQTAAQPLGIDRIVPALAKALDQLGFSKQVGLQGGRLVLTDKETAAAEDVLRNLIEALEQTKGNRRDALAARRIVLTAIVGQGTVNKRLQRTFAR